MMQFDRPHTISYFLAPFPIYYHLFSQNLKKSRDFKDIPFGSIISCMHSYSSVSVSTRNLKCLLPSFTNDNDMIGHN